MDNKEIAWLAVGDETDLGHPEMGSEWYGLRLTEKHLQPDMPDIELYDLCMYFRDKRFDDDRYQPLALKAETYLLARMSGKAIRRSEVVEDNILFEEDQFREATELIASGLASDMQLIDISDIAHSFRHGDLPGGRWWETLYDLARIQILRRIQRARLLPATANPTTGAHDARVSDQSRPNDATEGAS
jgi:hypothetical protein